MRTHPVFLRLEGRPCVVIGGDALAAAKVAACEKAGAEVTVIARVLGPELTALIGPGVRHVAREYRSGDLSGAFLAYASTRDAALAHRLAAEAEREHVLLNVVDMPEASTVIAPSVLQRGQLQIAIGTGGASPGLAAQLRRELEVHVGPEYALFVAVLGAVRERLAADPARAPERGAVVSALLTSPLLDLVRQERWEEADGVLTRIAGDACTLARLGIMPDSEVSPWS
jgi:siroheme synthase-like protein